MLYFFYMQFFIVESVAMASIMGFLVGALWYSPFLFMNAWLVGEGITKAQIPKRSKVYMMQINVYSLLSHGAIASVLALMFDLLQVSSLMAAISVGLLLCFGFIVTTRYIDMIYTVKSSHLSKETQVKFLVSSGYYITVTAVMSAILFLLA